MNTLHLSNLINSDFKTKNKTMIWKRYRLKTNAIEDYRPLIFNPKFPWWCSGSGAGYAIIIAYLPPTENLLDYWDDAFDVTTDDCTSIVFTDRFPKPSYFVESENDDNAE